MNAKHLIAALTIFTAAGAAFAADAPDAPATPAAAAATTVAAVSATQVAAPDATSRVNFPSARFVASERSREEVRAEAVAAVRNHQSTLSAQLELAK